MSNHEPFMLNTFKNPALSKYFLLLMAYKYLGENKRKSMRKVRVQKRLTLASCDLGNGTILPLMFTSDIDSPNGDSFQFDNL